MIDTRIDTATIQRAEKLHPRIKPLVFENLSKCIDMKVPIRIVQGLRTMDDQAAIYGKGRTSEQLKLKGIDNKFASPSEKIVSNAVPGSSWHNYGLSFDFCLLRGEKQISWNRDEDLDGDGKKDWDEVVNLFILKGFDWGGNWTSFPDYPHIQKVFGLTLTKAKQLISDKKVDSNGYIIF